MESEIETLKRRGRIRTFSLPINVSYVGVMMSKDYDADILRVAQRCGETGDQNTESALRCFCKLIAGRISSNISLSELTGNEENGTKSTEPSCIDRGSLSELTESGVDAVMAAGFILPKRDTPLMDMYYITHPQVSHDKIVYVIFILFTDWGIVLRAGTHVTRYREDNQAIEVQGSN